MRRLDEWRESASAAATVSIPDRRASRLDSKPCASGVRAKSRLREYLSWIQDSVWVEGVLHRSMHAQDDRIEFLGEAVHLQQTDTVLAGDRAAEFQCLSLIHI